MHRTRTMIRVKWSDVVAAAPRRRAGYAGACRDASTDFRNGVLYIPEADYRRIAREFALPVIVSPSRTIVSVPGTKPRGLGDTIASITHATGLDKVAEKAAKAVGLKDCGCAGRRESLNKLVPYR